MKYRYLLLLPVIVMSLWLGCSKNIRTTYYEQEEKVHRYLQLSNQDFKSGKFDRAIKYLKKVCKIRPEESSYLKQLANIYSQSGDYKQALNYLAKYRQTYQDKNPEKVTELLLFEGAFALSHGNANQALQLTNAGLNNYELYCINNPELLGSLYNNRGVIDLFSQGEATIMEDLSGARRKIHLRDVKRAKHYFQLALDCVANDTTFKYNHLVTEGLLAMPVEVRKKTYGYLSNKFVKKLDFNTYTIESRAVIERQREERDSVELTNKFRQLIETKKDVDEIVFVLDISGSMDIRVSTSEEITRLEFMKKAIKAQLLNIKNNKQKTGLITIGGGCAERPYIIIDAATKNAGKIGRKVQRLNASGGTPLYQTLKKSTTLFSDSLNNKLIFLASDGIAGCDCETSLCQLADEFCNAGIKIEVLSLLLDKNSNLSEFGVYSCMTNACESFFHAVTPSVELENRNIEIPEGYCTLRLNQQDLIDGCYQSVSFDIATASGTKNMPITL